MAIYNTNNPLGSVDPRDLLDNAQIADHYVSDVNNPTWTDRFGNQRKTWKGIETDVSNQLAAGENSFQQFLLSSGYEYLADYVDGPITFTRRNQITAYNGEFYRPKASVNLPYTTTGNTATTWETDKDDFVAMGDAALRQSLASAVGAALVGISNGMTLQDYLDGDGFISVMDYIPVDLRLLIQPTSTLSAALTAGDLYPYIFQADADALSKGKILVFPAGWYPISQSYNQTCFSVLGAGMNSYLIPTDDFEDESFLMQWAPSTAQPRKSVRNISFNGRGIDYSKRVGGFLVATGCHSSEIHGLYMAACTYGGLRINPTTGSTSGGRDIVNLNVDQIYCLDCGGTNYFAGVSVELNSSVSGGNWTDGVMRNIDISGTQPDLTLATGPQAFTITQSNGKQLYNVLFERFFTATRMNTHMTIYSANGRSYFTSNTLLNFKGETHYLPSGSTNTTIVTSYSASLPQINLMTAGYQCFYKNFYSAGSLLNQGIQILTGQMCTFEGLTFQPCGGSTLNDVNGNYLRQLYIAAACENLKFVNCDIRYITGTPQYFQAMNQIVDNGIMSEWESSQMTSSPQVMKPFSWFSTLATNVSTSKAYPSNATTYSTDITYANGTNGELILGFPVTSNTTDTANAKFAIDYPINQGASNQPYYYATMRVIMTSGIVNNHYLQLQIFGSSVVLTPDTMNKEYIVNFRFPVNSANKFVFLIVGHTTQASTAVSFTIKDLIITPNKYTYPYNYTKSLVTV